MQSIAQLFLSLCKSQNMKKRQTTIHDIARYLGIAASTVSRALNDHPRISEKTKTLVRKAAEQLDYKQNIVAANLRKGTGNTIGVIIPLINRFFFANIIYGIEAIANPAGYNILICPSDERLEKEINNILTLISNRVSGIMISISAETKNANHFDAVFNSGIPLVQFDRTIEHVPTSKVYNDDFQGAYENVTHLIGQGYRTVAHFAGPQYIVSYRRRLEGYRQALTDNKHPFREELVFEGVISREKGNTTMHSILQKLPGVDAVFAASDMSALGAIICLKKKHIQIPSQFGISGYVNEPFGEFIDPSLTTTEQYGVDIGKAAARELIAQIASPGKQSLRPIVITPQLIIRKSSLKSE
jgi:LacI family transcriptional regulator